MARKECGYDVIEHPWEAQHIQEAAEACGMTPKDYWFRHQSSWVAWESSDRTGSGVKKGRLSLRRKSESCKRHRSLSEIEGDSGDRH